MGRAEMRRWKAPEKVEEDLRVLLLPSDPTRKKSSSKSGRHRRNEATLSPPRWRMYGRYAERQAGRWMSSTVRLGDRG